jgi:hypothetical protein
MHLKLPPHNFPERENDCAIWAIAAFLGVPYEDVLIEAAREDSMAGKNGLHVSQICRICERLGTPVKLHKKFDLDKDVGILSLWLLEKGKKYGHVAVVFSGKVLDSIGGTMVWDADAYCRSDRAIVHGVIKPV